LDFVPFVETLGRRSLTSVLAETFRERKEADRDGVYNPDQMGWPMAMVGGVAWALSGGFAFAFPGEGPGSLGSTSSYLIESAHALAEGGMLVWLVGLRALQASRHGRLGTVGFFAAFVGTAFLFLLTALTPVQMFLAYTLDVIDPSAGGMLVSILFTSGLFLGWLVGYTVLGIATFRAKVLPRWCGLLLIAQCPLLLFLMGFYGAGGVVLGLVWLALGYVLFSQRGRAAKSVDVA
jgi:hypothetical protein